MSKLLYCVCISDWLTYFFFILFRFYFQFSFVVDGYMIFSDFFQRIFHKFTKYFISLAIAICPVIILFDFYIICLNNRWKCITFVIAPIFYESNNCFNVFIILQFSISLSNLDFILIFFLNFYFSNT